MASKKKLRKRIREMEAQRDLWRNAVEGRDRKYNELRDNGRYLAVFLTDRVLNPGCLDGSPIEATELRVRVDALEKLTSDGAWSLQQLLELRSKLVVDRFREFIEIAEAAETKLDPAEGEDRDWVDDLPDEAPELAKVAAKSPRYTRAREALSPAAVAWIDTYSIDPKAEAA
jgi:hypothetical protein